MAKVKLKNIEVLELEEELKHFATEKINFSTRFQLSKVQEEVLKATKMIREEQEKIQVIAEDKVDNGKGELVDVLTPESAKAVNDLFNEEIELSYTALKIKDIGELITDKPYRLVFKFFV